MFTSKFIVQLCLFLALTCSLASTGFGQTEPTRQPDPARIVAPTPSSQFKAPDNIDFKVANAWSEGVRLHVEMFSPKAMAGRKLPTIIQAHGWGGTAANLRRDAIDMASAGYQVITFDYRGWGESDSRLVLTKPSPITPAFGKNQVFTVEVKEVREYVDPMEQVTDWFSIINWAVGEPTVDADRIGIRGSSFSGGHVFYIAAREPRIKAVVSQVGSFDGRWVGATRAELEKTYDEATRRAHGAAYPEPRAVTVGKLVGAPIREKFLQFAPLEEAPKVKSAAVLFIVAEKEELFDNKDHALAAYQKMEGATKKYVVIPNIMHYGVYYEARNQVIKLATDWFDQYLKK